MATPFRLAVVGCGQIARKAHVPAALASPLTELVALVDPAQERARELAGVFGIRPRVAAEVDEVLDEVDGVVIATPNHTHHYLALKCLRAGVPILVEKPLATSVSEGEAIARASEQAQATVAVGYATRFSASVRLMRQLLEERYFGAVRRFAYQFGTCGGWAPLSGYNLDRQSTGGGVLVVTGTHFLDRLLYWFGYPEHVHLEDDSLGGPEANAVATFDYRSGPIPFEGVARFSKTVALKPGFVMETARGFVVLREDARTPILFRPHDRLQLESVIHARNGLVVDPQKDVFQLQLEDFVAACQARREPLVTARQGLQSLRLIQWLYSRRTQMREDHYTTLSIPSDAVASAMRIPHGAKCLN